MAYIILQLLQLDSNRSFVEWSDHAELHFSFHVPDFVPVSPNSIKEFRATEISLPGLRVGRANTEFHRIQTSVRSTMLSPEQVEFIENMIAAAPLSQLNQNLPSMSQHSQPPPASQLARYFSPGAVLEQSQSQSLRPPTLAMNPNQGQVNEHGDGDALQTQEGMSPDPREFSVVPLSNRLTPADDFWLSQTVVTPNMY